MYDSWECVPRTWARAHGRCGPSALFRLGARWWIKILNVGPWKTILRFSVSDAKVNQLNLAWKKHELKAWMNWLLSSPALAQNASIGQVSAHLACKPIGQSRRWESLENALAMLRSAATFNEPFNVIFLNPELMSGYLTLCQGEAQLLNSEWRPKVLFFWFN